MLESNYDMLLRSAITSLQCVYDEYKKSVKDSLNYTFYNSNGDLCILNGYEEKCLESMRLENEVKEKWAKVIILKNKMKKEDSPEEEPNNEDLPPKNWSGIWIDRRDAMLEIEDRIDDYREYTNDYEKGKYDAYVEAEDVITSLDGHD